MHQLTKNKRKHHVIPATYLAGFTDENDKLYEYRKDSPETPRYNIPRELGHKKDYYAQPTPDGGIDYNSIENGFSTLEEQWPSLLQKLVSRQHIQKKELEVLIQFLAMLRSRVPAARDATEFMLAEIAKSTLIQLQEMGELPPEPEELKDFDLIRDTKILIDPHRSIHAMITTIKAFGALVDWTGIRVIKNLTTETFITSDNPIAVFDPDIEEEKMKPYAIDKYRKKVEILFPLDKNHLLHLHTNYRSDFIKKGISYAATDKVDEIKRFNRILCKFAYEKVFSSSQEHKNLITKYSEISPVLKIEKIISNKGFLNISSYEFGHRKKLPKWQKKTSGSNN